MKYIISMIMLAVIHACSQQDSTSEHLQIQIDSLQQKLNKSYKPGLGEFMSSIQVHHNKLWFAGLDSNWKLADFEVNEIKEELDAIQSFNTDRPEVKLIHIIDPALDSVSQSIKQQNLRLFKSSFVLLTNTCNKCHQASQHEFNLIKIPTNPPFSNQNFNRTP